jgi:DNA-binding response OmpR family regulator
MQQVTPKKRALLFGNDSGRLCEQAQALLRRDYVVTTVTSSLAAARLLADQDYELVVIDAPGPGLERSSSPGPLH